jgi:hypothetical protein
VQGYMSEQLLALCSVQALQAQGSPTYLGNQSLQ